MLFENLSRWFCHSLNTLKTKESTEPAFPVNSQFTLGIGMIVPDKSFNFMNFRGKWLLSCLQILWYIVLNPNRNARYVGSADE